jgi:hypothetical protein
LTSKRDPVKPNPAASYNPYDQDAAVRSDEWQDFMIWYLLRRKGTRGAVEGVPVDNPFICRAASLWNSADQILDYTEIGPVQQTFDTTLFDNASLVDGDGFTIPLHSAGIYVITFQWSIPVSGLEVLKPGGGLIKVESTEWTPPDWVARASHPEYRRVDFTHLTCTATLPLYAGDVVTAWVFYESTADFAFDPRSESLSQYAPVLSIARIGPYDGDPPA